MNTTTAEVKITVSGCHDCPYFKKHNTGRESWAACHKGVTSVYGKLIKNPSETPDKTPNWCPLGLG